VSWTIPLVTPRFSLYSLETLNDLSYNFRHSNPFALFNLDTTSVLAYSFRDSKSFVLIILENETVLSYSLETPRDLPYSFGDSNCSGLII